MIADAKQRQRHKIKAPGKVARAHGSNGPLERPVRER
jgi:hypothetical protein